MSIPSIAAAIALVASLGLAYWLTRGGRDRPAFALLVASPVVAALALAGATALIRNHAVAAVSPPAGADAPQPGSGAPPPGHPAGGEAEALRSQAVELNRAKRFAEAREVYAKLVEKAPNDADAWADLADTSAAAAGGDLKAGSSALDRALAIDANHPKALWLKASLELQEKRYSRAVELWERLLALMPPDSNDARIIRANLDETRALAAQQGAGR